MLNVIETPLVPNTDMTSLNANPIILEYSAMNILSLIFLILGKIIKIIILIIKIIISLLF